MFDLIWFAEFNNGNTVQQFDNVRKQEQEHCFKEVLDRQDELKQFALVNVTTNSTYTVNLINGTISITSQNDIPMVLDDDTLKDNSYKYRLIYFRRVSRTFGLNLTEVADVEVTYFIGYQYIDENKKNHKRLMKIDKYGKVIIN